MWVIVVIFYLYYIFCCMITWVFDHNVTYALSLACKVFLESCIIAGIGNSSPRRAATLLVLVPAIPVLPTTDNLGQVCSGYQKLEGTISDDGEVGVKWCLPAPIQVICSG